MTAFYRQYKLLGFLGIIPIDVKHRSYWKRYFPLYLLCLYGFLGTFSIYERLFSDYYINNLHRVIYITKAVNEILFVVSVLAVPLIREQNWNTFLCDIKKMEQYVLDNHNSETKPTILGKFLTAFTYFFIITTAIHYISLSKVFNITDICLLFTTKLYQLIVARFCLNIVSIIEHFYEVLTNNLIRFAKKESDIIEITQLYRKLYDLISEFNKICGLQIFFFIFGALTSIIYILSQIIRFAEMLKAVELQRTIFSSLFSIVYLVRKDLYIIAHLIL